MKYLLNSKVLNVLALFVIVINILMFTLGLQDQESENNALVFPADESALILGRIEQILDEKLTSIDSRMLYIDTNIAELQKKAADRIPRWEYAISSIPDSNFKGSMDTAGENGWELVFARRASSGGYVKRFSYECIFKRPLLNY